MSYNPTEKDLVVVFDMQKEAFRMVNAKTVLEIKADKEHYKVEDGVAIKQ
jgi:hypothetical protein